MFRLHKVAHSGIKRADTTGSNFIILRTNLIGWCTFYCLVCFFFTLYLSCTLKTKLTSVKLQSHWSLVAIHSGVDVSSACEPVSVPACIKTHFWISMGLAEGLTLMSFLAVNCSYFALSKVISGFYKCNSFLSNVLLFKRGTLHYCLSAKQ